MKQFLAVAAFAAGVVAFSSAQADTINFGQFGPDFNVVSNGASGTTTDGVGFTITGPGSGLEALTNPAGGWLGIFPTGTPLVFDEGAPGAVTIDFNTPLTSIDQIAAQANFFGPFVATMKVYDGATLIDTLSYSADNTGVSGTMPAFSFSGASFTSLVFSTTDDGAGIGIGGVGGEGGYAPGVPEPSAWAIMLIGFLGLGTMSRLGRRSFAKTA